MPLLEAAPVIWVSDTVGAGCYKENSAVDIMFGCVAQAPIRDAIALIAMARRRFIIWP